MRYLAVAGRGRRAKREAKQRAPEVLLELAAEEQVGGELFRVRESVSQTGRQSNHVSEKVLKARKKTRRSVVCCFS